MMGSLIPMSRTRWVRQRQSDRQPQRSKKAMQRNSGLASRFRWPAPLALRVPEPTLRGEQAAHAEQQEDRGRVGIRHGSGAAQGPAEIRARGAAERKIAL